MSPTTDLCGDRMSTTDLFPHLIAGDRSALARAITLVESEREADRVAAEALVERCLARSGGAMRIGITGIPGVGKSTLIDALGMHYVEAGHRVAVLAVDPSSGRSHGSILGDKTRMVRLSQHPNAFIRPTAAGGMLGGLARRTREVVLLCEAAGYDRVLIETVGVGQNELEVDHLCDIGLLLTVAGTGDELQGIKRGIMEAADVVVLTKAGGDQAPRAEEARQQLRSAIRLLPARPSGRRPEVLLTDSLLDTGIRALAHHVESLLATDRANGYLEARRQEQALHWMHRAIETGLRDLFRTHPAVIRELPRLEAAVRNGRTSPFAAAEELLNFLRTGDAPRS